MLGKAGRAHPRIKQSGDLKSDRRQSSLSSVIAETLPRFIEVVAVADIG
jgi:hypothetical protein